jgi:hypothetical protein
MMSISELPDVLTPEDVASFIQVSPEAVFAEIAAGRIKAFVFGGETRIQKRSLIEALVQDAPGSAARSPSIEDVKFSLEEIRPSAPFEFTFPAAKGRPKNVESYPKAYETRARVGNGQTVKVVVGITKRESSGKKDRERILILIDGQPLVEFIGADDFDRSRLVASIIKPDGSKHLRVGDHLPPEYASFDTRPYNQVVTGPRAKKGMAVVCTIDDLGTMVRHALIRWEAKRAARA